MYIGAHKLLTMSAIAKPLLLPFATGLVSGGAVPVEQIASMEAFDDPGDVRGAPQATKYAILINFNGLVRPTEKWYYTTSTTRNTALANARATAATVAAP